MEEKKPNYNSNKLFFNDDFSYSINENNFFYYADSILTGTKTWPNKDYQGKKIYSGMIENINLIKSQSTASKRDWISEKEAFFPIFHSSNLPSFKSQSKTFSKNALHVSI